MRLACVSVEGRGGTDSFLAAAVARLEAAGLRLAGTVQTNIDRPDRPKCDMDLRILPDGPMVRISEDRGALARGCRLDLAVLEQTVAEVMRRLDGADLLVVNKFGKREAEGRGLVPVIAAALDAGIPVLAGVNRLNLDPFLAFSGGMAEVLPARIEAVLDWCQTREAANVG